MNNASRAGAYLIGRTTRNWIAHQAARLRSPRYALALVAAGAYLWFLMLGPTATAHHAGYGTQSMFDAMAAIGVALLIVGSWLIGRQESALAFQPAEVQFLFPAPVTRRGLITYRVVRAQLLILLNAVIWVFLLRRLASAVPPPLRYGAAWGLFSVLSLHRLAIALLQVSPITGVRRIAILCGKVLAVAVIVAIGGGISRQLLRFGQMSPIEWFNAVGDALHTGPAAVALTPFRWLVAPLFVTETGSWLRAFAVVVGIAALHFVWVLGINVDFQEAAAAASAKSQTRREAFKARRAGGATVAKPGAKLRAWFPLAPTGQPGIAIVWKNTTALMRTGLWRSALGMGLFIFIIVNTVSSGEGSHHASGAAIAYGSIALTVFIMGPRFVRNDLRQDLLNLASLKSYPLGGATIVIAEMASPTLALALFQVALMVMAMITVATSGTTTVSMPVIAVLVLIAPIAVVGLNALNVGIQNGAALLFPGWIRIGASSGGMEALGQTMLVTFGSFFALGLALLLPATAGIAGLFAIRLATGSVAAGTVSGIVAGTVALGLELFWLVQALGRVFERTDPTTVA